MHLNTPKAELVMCWVALLFVCGEFSIAMFDLLWDGRALALFMAVNTLMRETKGGKHYHHILLRAFVRVRSGITDAVPAIHTSTTPKANSAPGCVIDVSPSAPWLTQTSGELATGSATALRR